MLLRLLVTEGPLTGQTRELSAGQLAIVGRAEHSDFRIPGDRHLSGRHLLIECTDDGCRLLDLNSTNGSWLNGARVAGARLHDGDVVVAGRTVLRVSIESDVTPAAKVPQIGNLRTIHAESVSGQPAKVDALPSSIHDRICSEELEHVPEDDSTEQIPHLIDLPVGPTSTVIPSQPGTNPHF